MDVGESNDAVLSKDNNIDNMLNNSRTGFWGTTRRKKSMWTIEGNHLVNRVGMLNKTHDYHYSSSNLRWDGLKMFGLDEERDLSLEAIKTLGNNNKNKRNIDQNVLQSFKRTVQMHNNSRSSQRYANILEIPTDGYKPEETKFNRSIVKYLESSKGYWLF
jgi:hypothetical protein